MDIIKNTTMAYRALLWNIYILLLATAVNVSLAKPNAPSVSTGGSKRLEDLVNEALEIFVEFDLEGAALDNSSFQTLSVNNDRIGLTSELDVNEGTDVFFEYKDPTDHDLLYQASYFEDDDFDCGHEHRLSPYVQNYPLMNYPNDLGGTTFAQALKFMTDIYGIMFRACWITKPPKDPFREGQLPLEAMWLFYTDAVWPQKRVYVVTTSLAVWGNFTKDDLGIEHEDEGCRAGYVTKNTTYVKGKPGCNVSTS